MAFNVSIYGILMTIITLSGCSLFSYILLVKPRSNTRDYFLLALSSTLIWCGFYTLGLFVMDFQLMKYLLFLRMIGPVTLAPLFLIFILVYTRDFSPTKNPIILLLFILPFLHYLIFITDDINGGLFFASLIPNTSPPFYRFDFEYGPIYYSHMIYSYLIVLVSFFVLIQTLITSTKGDLYQRQGILMILAAVIPLLATIIQTFRLIPALEYLNLTPISFIFIFIIYYYLIYEHEFPLVRPIALKRVFEEIKDGIIVLDRNYNVMNINSTALKFLSVSEESTIYGKEFFSTLKKLKEQNNFRLSLDKIHTGLKDLQKGTSDIYQCDTKLVKLDLDSQTIYFSFSITPVRQKTRDVIGFILIMRDITTQKRAEKVIDFLHSLLRHDMGNKIQIIRGYLSLLLESSLGGEERELAKIASQVCNEGMIQIQKIRQLKDIDQALVELPQQIDIKPILENIVNEYTNRAAQLGIQIELESGYPHLEVHAGLLLYEMFSNLVDNALVHSKCNHLKIKVTPNNEEVLVTIEDNGIGVPDGIKGRIFEEGFRGAGSTGSGLGLYLAKTICESYGGRISVHDSERGGASFVVTLKKA